MADLFGQALAIAVSPADVRRDQAAFIKQRNQCGANRRCLANVYGDRNLALENLLQGSDEGPVNDTANADNTGPSFDCNTVTAVSELVICGNDQLLRLDRQMSDRLLDALNACADRALLNAQQEVFVSDRNLCEGDVDCMRSVYNARIRQIDNEPRGVSCG